MASKPLSDLPQNLNSKLIEMHNSGCVRNNSNSIMDISNCKLKVENNSNATVIASNSNLELAENTNLSVNGSHNTLKLLQNVNPTIKGDKIQLEANYNTNLDILSNNCFMKLVKNTNLSVFGNFHKATVSNTTNHNVTGVGKTEPQAIIENKFELQQRSSTRFSESLQNVASFFKISIQPVQTKCRDPTFKVEFVDNAIIDGSQYKLGNVDFTVKSLNTNEFEVKVNTTSLEKGSITKEVHGTDEIIFTTIKDGNLEKLRVKGPLVSSYSDNTAIISCTKTSNM